MNIKKTIFFFTLVLFFGLFDIKFIYATNEEDAIFEKIVEEIDVSDDFADDTIIVILGKQYSEVNKEPDISIFKDILYSEIIDLSHIDNDNSLMNKNDFEQVLEIKLNNHSKIEVINAINVLSQSKYVKYAGPNRYLQLDNVPNDPFYPTTHSSGGQWSHSIIQSESAWDFTTGSHNVRVGIIDTGVSSHTDLNANVTTGLDFVNMNGNNPGSLRDDPDGHGTHVAGILGADGNQIAPTGIAGVNWDVTIVPMQVARANKTIDSTACVRAVYYAINQWNTNNRINILSMSIGGYDVWPGIESAIRQYQGLFICSTGNSYQNNDIDGNHHYPSFYASDLYSNPIPNMITVGRTDINDNHPIGASWGEHSILIYAPGQNIISTVPLALCTLDGVGCTTLGSHEGYGYHSESGSSMATPHVSGVAALLLSINSNLSAQQLKNAILNGADTITIQVPNDETSVLEDQSVKRLNSYKAIKYVLEHYLSSSNVININCFTHINNLIGNCSEGNSIVYKINVECGKSYQFVSNALSSLDMTFYDSNFNVITSITPTMTNNNCTGTITTYLSLGTYYLKVKYTSDNDSGNISTSYKATWPSDGEHLVLGTNTNVMTHLHPATSNNYYTLAYYDNISGAGYYKITLTANVNSTYPPGAIKIFSDSNRQYLIDRYDVNGMIAPASSKYGENIMYVFLPDTCTYYFEITMPSNNYASLNFKIERSDINNFDYTNNLIYQSYNVLFENQSTYSYFEEVTISHRSKFQLDVSSLNLGIDTIPIYIFKREAITGNNPYNRYYCTKVSNSNWFLTINNTSAFYTFILDEGTYYFGYADNTYGASLNFALKRIVDYDASSLGTLITDPAINQGFTLGSEVNFNDGLLQGTTITEGFTRCIYIAFDNFIELPDSRLDYDWYSSNDSVAMVTNYGTVLGKPVSVDTSVRIYAVLKIDPSVVFSILLTILDDVETDEIEIVSYLSYSYLLENGTYQLELDNSNSPYPWINYYSWIIDIPTEYPNLVVSMNQWGYITSNGTGEVILTGSYYLNQRVTLTIYLTITT